MIIGDSDQRWRRCHQLQQPRAIGIEELAAQYAAKITFQSLAPTSRRPSVGTEADIQKMDDSCASGPRRKRLHPQRLRRREAIGVPVERKKIMFDYFMQKDPGGRRVDGDGWR